MTIDQLQVFKTIVDLGSFRAAAEATHRAQSAVSYSIKQLEAQLGFNLFDRQSYRPELTKKGQRFFEEVVHTLSHIDHLEELGEQLAGNKEPLLRLSVTPLVCMNDFLPLLGAFRIEFPDTELQINLLNLKGPIEALEQNQCDFAISEMPAGLPNWEHLSLKNIEMLPVVSPQLIPFTGERQIQPLTNYTQIVVADSPTTKATTTVGVLSGTKRWTVTDFPTKHLFIRSGLGWGNLPKHMIQEDLNAGWLTVIPKARTFTLDMHLYWKPDFKLGPAAQFFLNKINNYL